MSRVSVYSFEIDENIFIKSRINISKLNINQERLMTANMTNDLYTCKLTKYLYRT